jgi:6-phosphogluconolactonase
VIVSGDGRLLFAVNAGSDSISSFRVRHRGLELVDVEPSGGAMPTSLAFQDSILTRNDHDRGLLYVLNAGVPNNVSGLIVDDDSEITPLAGSARPS